MLKRSLRYLLIFAILALFLAVFISSTGQDLTPNSLTTKKNVNQPLKITIKKPTAQKSNVVKMTVAKSVSASTKTTQVGGGGTFAAKGKTTTSVTNGKIKLVKATAAKSFLTSTKTTKAGGGTILATKGKTTSSEADGKIQTTIKAPAKIISSVVKSTSSQQGKPSNQVAKSSLQSHMSFIKSVSPSGQLGKSSTISSSSSNAKENSQQKPPIQINHGQNGSSVGKHLNLTNEKGKNQSLPQLPKTEGNNSSGDIIYKQPQLIIGNEQNTSGILYYYPFPNNFDLPNGTIMHPNGQLSFPNRTTLEASQVAQIFYQERKEPEQQYPSQRYPQPNIYQFPVGTMISGNGSIIFANGTEILPTQYGKLMLSIARDQVKNNYGKLFPFPNDYGLPNNTVYFQSNKSFVAPNGTVFTQEKLAQMKTEAQQEKPIKYFTTPNPYNFPDYTALYKNDTVVFPNKTVITSQKFGEIKLNTPSPIYMPNSFGYSKSALVYPNASVIIESERKIVLDERQQRLLRAEMQIFSVAQQWPQPNEEGFPSGTRFLGNNSILFPNNTYCYDKTVLSGSVAVRLQSQIKAQIQSGDNQYIVDYTSQQWMTPNNMNVTKPDLGLWSQTNVSVLTNRTTTTKPTSNGTSLTNGQERLRLLRL